MAAYTVPRRLQPGERAAAGSSRHSDRPNAQAVASTRIGDGHLRALYAGIKPEAMGAGRHRQLSVNW